MNYIESRARNYIAWLPGSHPTEDLLTAMRIHGIPKCLHMNSEVLLGLELLRLVLPVYEQMSRHLPRTYLYSTVMGLRVKCDDSLPKNIGMGRVVLDSLARERTA